MSTVRERFLSILCPLDISKTAEEVADALCAALPVVSREAIVRCLNAYWVGGCFSFQCYDLPGPLLEKHASELGSLPDALLRLVSGEETQQPWCPHIRWLHNATYHGWYMPGQTSANNCVEADGWPSEQWRACPICAAPRPHA